MKNFNQIAKNMSNGIGFFNPSFVGEPEQALRWVVDNQLSPSPLGRAAFAEKSLEWAVRTGTEQYLIWGAGYDTFAYRQPLWAKALQIFEVDHPATARDKQERLKSAGIVIPDNVHYIEADFTKGTWKKKCKITTRLIVINKLLFHSWCRLLSLKGILRIGNFFYK